MSYETWRIGYQNSEQAARAAFQEVERLREALHLIANQGPYYGPDGTWKTWRHWAEIARDAIKPANKRYASEAPHNTEKGGKRDKDNEKETRT